jgi:hypothetical protein
VLPFNRANPRKQGDVGLGSAVGWFAANGYTVSLPLTDSQDYDVVVDDGEGLARVQVRTTRHRQANGLYAYGFVSTAGTGAEPARSSTLTQARSSYCSFLLRPAIST